ncbi:MAG: hypothetical protein GF416_00240 [Candidatus Altiarchaeales archaeon]|nr:hypothetical protein [Candidatus Altiarchaeales archaeon]MBD3415550.1 hypothetical protein [Candidatus Altiarchaeales archaeon]
MYYKTFKTIKIRVVFILPLPSFSSMLSRIRTYFRVTNVLDIAGRYFVLNGFDGLYTMMGVIVGSYVAGHHDPDVVLGTGFAGIVALGVSGSASAYLAERAMREKELKKLERSMLVDLGDTLHEDARSFAALFSSVVNGLSPVLTALIMISPFMAARLGLLAVEYAFMYSMLIGGLEIFLVGCYLGKISKSSMISYGVKMILVAVVAVILSYIIGSLLG